MEIIKINIFISLVYVLSIAHTVQASFPFEVPEAPIKLNGSVSKTLGCNRNSSGGLLITPSFPMSGSGWIQTLLYSSLMGSGVQNFHAEGKPHFGINSFYIGDRKFEWLFTHDNNDAVWASEGIPSVEFRHRPVIMFRVVRSALYNVESFYRYSERERAKNNPDDPEIDFDKFAFKAIREYRSFHDYYTSKCQVGNEGKHTKGRVYSNGHMTKYGEFPKDLCCIDVTFEDLQNSLFVRELLRKLLEMWIGDYVGVDAIWSGVEKATRYLKPLHASHGSYSSGERYTAAHLLTLTGTKD